MVDLSKGMAGVSEMEIAIIPVPTVKVFEDGWSGHDGYAPTYGRIRGVSVSRVHIFNCPEKE